MGLKSALPAPGMRRFGSRWDKLPHLWPEYGTIRTRVAVILGHGPQILPEDLPAHLRTRQTPVRQKTRQASMSRPTLEELERDYIATVLGEIRWHRRHAAHILGIDRRTLYRKIRTYRLQPTTPAEGGA